MNKPSVMSQRVLIPPSLLRRSKVKVSTQHLAVAHMVFFVEQTIKCMRPEWKINLILKKNNIIITTAAIRQTVTNLFNTVTWFWQHICIWTRVLLDDEHRPVNNQRTSGSRQQQTRPRTAGLLCDLRCKKLKKQPGKPEDTHWPK